MRRKKELKMNIMKLAVAFIGALGVAYVAGAAESQSLLNVSYDPTRELWRDVDDGKLGDRQSDRTRQLAGEHLGHERSLSLAGTAELRHVQAVVVGLDETGQRSTLAQRAHIARGRHVAQPSGHVWQLRSSL